MPGGTQPTGAGHQGRPAGQAGNSLRTLGCGAQTVSSAVLSLRALAAGVDHLARRDLGPKRPRTPARAKTGARVPCDRRVAFRPFPTPRGLRSVGGGGGFEGIGVETVVGVEARCGTVAPARRRLRGYSVACQAHGHRGPTAQGLLSQSPYRCRGRAVEAGSSEADVVCRDGTGAPAGRRVSLDAGRSGLVPLTLATVVGRHLAAVCISFVPSGATRDAIWPRRTCWTSSRPAVLAGSCRWRRRVGARPLGPRLHLQDY